MFIYTNSKSCGMISEGLFLDSTADRINLGLEFEVLYMLDLYSDVVNRVLVFFLYVSDMLCSICWVVRYLTPTLWVVEYLRLQIRVWDYLHLYVWLVGNLRLTFLC